MAILAATGPHSSRLLQKSQKVEKCDFRRSKRSPRNMRCKGPRIQNFLLSSRFYLTGSKSEIDRKIPRLPSRACDAGENFYAIFCAKFARKLSRANSRVVANFCAGATRRSKFCRDAGQRMGAAPQRRREAAPAPSGTRDPARRAGPGKSDQNPL